MHGQVSKLNCIKGINEVTDKGIHAEML